ncbi:MAG: isoaspartyl peptidase/L-asparaginase [Myxococcota bacterium]
MSWSLAIHGGAGLVRRDSLGPDEIRTAEAGLNAALDAGVRVLGSGGTALDAVTEAIVVLEEWPCFNAGRGAVLAEHGGVELDAALMDGGRRVGAVTGVRSTRNPVRLAREVLEDGHHVMLAGPGTDRWARLRGLEQVDPAWFVTTARSEQLARVGGSGGVYLDHDDVTGTVGAVARDVHGGLAAGNSTGGMVNKRQGRVGDSPVIGGGTFAWNRTCAVAATGHGEPFVRACAAHRISDLIELAGLSLADAADRVLAEVRELGGTGGVIAVDAQGTLVTPFDSGGMYRGTARPGERHVAIW